MASSIKHRLVTVYGDGYKYTNPGGFVRRSDGEYVIARRNKISDDMATEDSKKSSVVLLKRTASLELSDTNIVLLKGDEHTGYEDPRLVPCDILKNEQGFTYTLVKKDSYCSWIKGLRIGKRSPYNKKMGPPVLSSKNGFLFRASDGSAVIVSRPDGEPLKFYKLKSIKRAMVAFAIGKEMEWWKDKLFAEIPLPSWACGKQGSFGHIGFGTVINSRAAIVHFGRNDDRGKYYVTALQRLHTDGAPIGPPEIIAEPAKNLPIGDVPNVIYTMMAWVDGRELVMWSGHDDTFIVETRIKNPL